MKKLVVMVLLALLTSFIYSQVGFDKDSVITIDKTKDQIYNESKLFIAETWRSSTDVIQLDDKDNGIILLKGGFSCPVYSSFVYIGDALYHYTVKIQIKENKCKISIYSIIFDGVTGSKNSKLWSSYDMGPNIEFPGANKSGMYKKNWDKLMNEIKMNTNSIVSLYARYIITSNSLKLDEF